MRTSINKFLLGTFLLLGLWSGIANTSSAQDAALRRQIRTYIPPDQLVSFLPSTPFDRFVQFLNPIFQRVTAKQIIDPESRKHPIGISIAGMHFLDALELVLGYNNLQYRETEQFFMIEVAPESNLILDSEAALVTAGGQGVRAGLTGPPASLTSRQIRINAILFEIDHTRSRDMGLDWSRIVGTQQQGSRGRQSGGVGGQQQQGLTLFVDTEDLFPNNSRIIGPKRINVREINSLIRIAEVNGLGETIASPSITVQSGMLGSIQVGSDIPVQVRDFSGNAVTQFFKTGIIIDVTPTLITEPIADTLGSPELEFIHLDVKVEKSSGRPSVAGIVIDRNQATTQLLLLDGEQSVIGGMYSTDESITRTGIPILKDLPGWFFGLKYLFGRTQRAETQKELIIVLQAEIIEPLLTRSNNPFRNNLLQDRRDEIQRALQRFNESVREKVKKPRDFSGQNN
ncbi:MAG: type II and III secretion system protein [Rhodothermia bacterium]|nr:MAG: type II and III secretion system protein [Rhodothermia bacterium]